MLYQFDRNIYLRQQIVVKSLQNTKINGHLMESSLQNFQANAHEFQMCLDNTIPYTPHNEKHKVLEEFTIYRNILFLKNKSTSKWFYKNYIDPQLLGNFS